MAQPTSPDPVFPIDHGSPEIDDDAHVRTLNAFMSIGRWFVVHLFILLAALYFVIVGGQPGIGLARVLLSIGLLVYRMLRPPSSRADVGKGLEAGPGPPYRDRVDCLVGESDSTA